MYEVYLDGQLLYYPADDEFALLEANLNLELNTAGTFDFTVPNSNPLFDKIYCRSSMVQILKNEKEIYYGEVREVGRDFYNNKLVKSTGELAFLFDSIQPQAEYHDMTSRQLLETWLNIHNSQVEDRKKFYVGTVSIHDSNDSLYRYTNRETTLDAIREKLVERLEGYLKIRKVNGKRYLDWITIEEYGTYREQPIKFGVNLLDYSETLTAENIATAVIPLGTRLEESPIEALEAYTDITSVNNGKDYVYIPEAVERFGWVKRVVTWDDVTQPANLKKKGEEWLRDNQYETMVLELTALDLAQFGLNCEDYNLGDTVPANAVPYGLDRTFPVYALNIDMLNPDQNNLVLGSTMLETFSKQTDASNRRFSVELENTRQTTAWMQAAIDNATSMMTGSKGGYKVTEFDEDGKWLRDLYMNAPSKGQATRLMQINMNGIGFSRDGFDGPYKNAWTIDGVFLGEFIKAGSVSAEKLSVEYKSSVEKAITSKFEVAENLISAEVKRAQGQEVELAAALKITSESIEGKVSKGEFGSYVQQYYDRVIIGFNDSSKYVQLGAGQIDIYDNGVSSSKLRSRFDQNGNHFWRDGYYVGKIGTNSYVRDTSKKGLAFDLEHQGAYMTWATQDYAGASTYTMKWTFARSGIGDYAAWNLHAGCDIDMHNYGLKNVNLINVRANNIVPKTGSVMVTREVYREGEGISWIQANLVFENGLLVGW